MTEITSRLSTALADRYQIERHLGEGGMATVYLAEDLKHKRKVAVKVLRPELAAVLGAERFVQEITTTANLQHPHILPLFDSGEADSFLYYVMPFIDGETLRDKLNRETQLGIEEAVQITTDVADALHYAHGEGVIHRDIKPENILLHKGRPMVADFGIALAVSAAAGGRMTETGLSLGTPHYMSPEQATAEKELTARSDVYSLGSVLFEMLTGEPPHTGASAQAIIMKIVTEDAQPVTELRKSVPPNVAAATARSLSKLAADRFDSAAKFAEALTNPAFTSPQGVATAPSATGKSPWNRLTVGFAVLSAILLGTTLLGLPAAEPPADVMRLSVKLPAEAGLRYGGGSSIELSSDGRRLVYVSSEPSGLGRALWLRDLDRLEVTLVAGTEGAVDPSFSPDGQAVVFATTNLGASASPVRVAPLDGGPPRTIGIGFPPVEWSDDGYIYFLTGDSPGSDVDRAIVRVPAQGGGEPDTVLRTGALAPLWVDAFPNGRGLVYTLFSGVATSAIVVLDFDTGDTVTVSPGVFARYASSGHLLVAHGDGSLVAMPFDQNALRATGPAVSLLDGIWIGPFGGAQLTVTPTGSLMYVPGEGWGESLVWVDRNGEEELVDPSWTQVDFRYLALSRDGTRLAVSVADGLGQDIWIKHVGRDQRPKITFDGLINHRPSWYPDGQAVLFISDRSGSPAFYRKRSDGSGDADLVLAVGDLESGSLSDDGSWLVLGTLRSGEGAGDILGLRLGTDTVPVPLVATRFGESEPNVSPNGKWLAYVSNESGTPEVYVVPFPNTGDGRWLVSSNGGQEPVWGHDGTELFYKSPSQLIVAEVASDDTFDVLGEKALFDITDHQNDLAHRRYDVTPDGQRFVMIRNIPFEGQGEDPVLVLNFFEELKAKVGN